MTGEVAAVGGEGVVPEARIQTSFGARRAGRVLLEESREMVVVLDAEASSSPRAARPAGRWTGSRRDDRCRTSCSRRGSARARPGPVRGRRAERGARLPEPRPGELAAYEELSAGFTAAVSHELRTPLARLLALLETASLPGQDAAALVEQARTEVEQIRELIDEVLFLSELETGRAPSSRSGRRARCRWSRCSLGFEETRTARASRSGRKGIPRRSCRFDPECCASSSRTSPRTRSATRDPEPTSPSPCPRGV